MKFGCILSICAILLISLPLIDALIQCPFKTEKVNGGLTNCTEVCVAYSCPEFGNGSESFGCQTDFLKDCGSHKKAAEAIEAVFPRMTKYYDGKVTYVSGCDGEENVKECITEKLGNFTKEISGKPGQVIQDYGFDINGMVADLIQMHDNNTTPAPPPDTTTTNASKGQDGNIWKKIGCFALGLILAAWIY